MQAKEISRQLAQRAGEIVRYLLPNGRQECQEWRVGSVDGEAGKSLGVCLSGDKAGIWCDFAGDPEARGDLLDLWAMVRRITLQEAIKEAACWLGIASPKFDAYKPPRFKIPMLQNTSTLTETSPVVSYLITERKLTLETIQIFRIEEKSTRIIFPYWRDGELIFVKYLGLERPQGKKQIYVEKDCEPCLFGWHIVPPNAREITLCEGEIDAMSLHQYGIPALSVPFGGGGGGKQRWLEHEFDRLEMFDEINLCFDNDAEGDAAVIELVERLGRHRCRVVTLPCKDANACLQAGISRAEIDKAFQNARTLDPAELKRASSFVEEVINEFYLPLGVSLGITLPWEKTHGKILFRPDELSVWTGINGHGKSQLLGQIVLHAIKQGKRVCIASLELKPKRLLLRLTRQAAGLTEPTEGFIRAIHEWYGESLWIFNLVGTAKAQRLLEVFRYARQRYGIDMFVIDSFMKLDIAEDDYRAQKAFIELLCDFKNEHNCHVHLVVHPRKGADETHPPGKLDNKGSGAISDLADNCFTVWRNKRKEDCKALLLPEKQLTDEQKKLLQSPDCLLICDKQRNGEWEGKIYLWFDPKSFQYLSAENERSKQFVDYSLTHQQKEESHG